MPDAPASQDQGPSVLFMHCFKSGGTSVHAAVTADAAPAFCCPIRQDNGQKTGRAIAADNDAFLDWPLVSGHFDWRRFEEIRKRRPCLGVIQLRDPVERLASAYNYLRAHRREVHPGLEAGGLQDPEVIRAAQTMPMRDFFASGWCLGSPAFNNIYVQTLAPQEAEALGGFSTEGIAHRTLLACERLERCDHVGLLERQVETVNFIRRTLGLAEVSEVLHAKRTADEMSWHEWLEPVELCSADELAPYVQELVSGDRLVYEKAKQLNRADT